MKKHIIRKKDLMGVHPITQAFVFGNRNTFSEDEIEIRVFNGDENMQIKYIVRKFYKIRKETNVSITDNHIKLSHESRNPVMEYNATFVSVKELKNELKRSTAQGI